MQWVGTIWSGALIQFRIGQHPWTRDRILSNARSRLRRFGADTDHVGLSLSAAEHLLKARLPSFIVVLAVDAKKNFTAMHVFHMLDQHLERVLKRPRTATAEGSLRLIIELSFSLAASMRLPNRTAMRSGSSSSAQSATIPTPISKEAGSISEPGVWTSSLRGKFTVRAKSEAEIAELFLGLRSVEVTAFQSHEIRFGIKLPDYTTQSGRLSIPAPQPVAACKIIARRGGTSVDVPGKNFISQRIDLTGNILFASPTTLFEMIVSGTDLTISSQTPSWRRSPRPLNCGPL